MQVIYVHSIRPVFRRVNRTFSHASCVRMGSAPAKDLKKYSDTLLLPQTSLPMRHDAAVVERTFANKTGPQLYRWQVRNSNPVYSKHSLRTTSRKTWLDLYSSFTMVRRMQMDDCIWVILSYFLLDAILITIKATPSTRS